MILVLACGPATIGVTQADSGSDADTGDDSDTGNTGNTGDTGTLEAPPAEISHWAELWDHGIESADLAVAPDGTVLALAQTAGALWLFTSADGGLTFGEAVEVAAGSFSGHDIAHPSVATDGSRVAIAGALGQEMAVWIGNLGGSDFVRHGIGADRDDLMYEGLFVRPHFAPDGELWASVHAFPADGGWQGGWKGVARESADFSLADATGPADGEPCECCPQDLAFTPSGRAVLGYRNNVENIRDTWVAISDTDGSFDTHTEVSDNDWFLTYCPVQGPRLAANDDHVVLAWADAAEGAYTVRVVTADTVSLAFSAPVDAAVDAGGVQFSPTLAVDSQSRVWLAFDQTFQGGWLVTSGDAGATWGSATAIESPSGPLLTVEVVASPSGQGPALVTGVTEDGAGWVGVLAD